MKTPIKLIALLLAASLSGSLFAEEHEGRDSRNQMLPSADNKSWRSECGACHIPYAPAFLPERSWRSLMGQLDKHFGSDASLDSAVSKSITEFLAANAADRSDMRRARKIDASIPASQSPLRITKTAWFERKHDEVRADVWKRKAVQSAANCGACHPGAEKGNFGEHDIRIPR